MGWKTGITCLKLTRQRAKNSRRRRTGVLRSVIMEAMEERYSKDPDLDRSRTENNEYLTKYRKGEDLANFMEEKIDEFSELRYLSGGRRIRSTASVGYAVIVKPDSEQINQWSPEKRAKFWSDSKKVLHDILGKTVVGGVIQRDEGAEHMHLFGLGVVDGEICVDKLINPRTFDRFNHEYPKKMRDLGWVDMVDCEPTPGEEPQPHGEPAIKYKRRKNNEKAKELAKKEQELDKKIRDFEAMKKRAEVEAKEQAARNSEKAMELAKKEHEFDKKVQDFEADIGKIRAKARVEGRAEGLAQAQEDAGRIRAQARAEGLAQAQNDLDRRQLAQNVSGRLLNGSRIDGLEKL